MRLSIKDVLEIEAQEEPDADDQSDKARAYREEQRIYDRILAERVQQSLRPLKEPSRK